MANLSRLVAASFSSLPLLSSSVSKANLSCLVATFISSFAFPSSSHGQPEPFGSCIILQSCSSFFFCLHSQPELFVSKHLLQSRFLFNSLSSPCFNLLRVARRCFSWLSVFSFSHLILRLSFLCSLFSEALYAISF